MPKQNAEMVAVTALGQDRPGIVRDVTQVLWRAKCNLHDTSMTILSGRFAMILIASVPQSQKKQLQKGLAALEKKTHLHIDVSRINRSKKANNQTPSAIVTVIGADHPGIVCSVAKLLSQKKANITDLNSKILTSKQKKVYVMIVEIALPAKMTLPSLQRSLSHLAKRLRVDIQCQPLHAHRL